MSMNTSHVFKPHQALALTSLPRKDNHIYQEIPDIKVSKVFHYVGPTGTGGGTLWLDPVTGKTYPLSAQYFLPYNFRIAGVGVAPKALMVLSNARMVRVSDQVSRSPSPVALPGTIFSSFQETSENRYLVCDQEGTLYTISKSMVVKLVINDYTKLIPEAIKEKDLSEPNVNPFREKAKTLKPVEDVECYSFNPATKEFTRILSTEEMVPGVQYYLINTEDGLPIKLEKI